MLQSKNTIFTILILQSLLRGIDADRCSLVDKHQLVQSCSVCNKLILLNFPATKGSHVKAACMILSRNNCCLYKEQHLSQESLSQDSASLEPNRHMFHYLSLIWLKQHKSVTMNHQASQLSVFSYLLTSWN